MLLDRSYSAKRMAFVSLLFVETCPEEQQDGHDLVLCELRSINLLVLVGGRALLCHISLMLGRVFSHLIASQRTQMPKQCVWWRVDFGRQVSRDQVICPVYTSQDIRTACCHFPEWGLARPVLSPEASVSTLTTDRKHKICSIQKHLHSTY